MHDSAYSWPLPRPLISELTMVRALQPMNASPDCKLSTVPKIQRQRSGFYACLCQEMTKPVPTKAFLQPAKTATMSWLCLPTSPCPTLSASAEPMFKTDCANWSLTCGQSCVTTWSPSENQQEWRQIEFYSMLNWLRNAICKSHNT